MELTQDTVEDVGAVSAETQTIVIAGHREPKSIKNNTYYGSVV